MEERVCKLTTQKSSEEEWESLIMCHRRIKAWIGEDTWSIFERPLDCKEIKPVNPKGNQSWIFIGRTDPEADAPILWPPDTKSQLIGKDPDAGKDWRQGEGDDRGWDDWIALWTQWTWVWASFGSWWWTGKPGVLQSMGSQRFRHDWATEQQQHCGGQWVEEDLGLYSK